MVHSSPHDTTIGTQYADGAADEIGKASRGSCFMATTAAFLCWTDQTLKTSYLAGKVT